MNKQTWIVPMTDELDALSIIKGWGIELRNVRSVRIKKISIKTLPNTDNALYHMVYGTVKITVKYDGPRAVRTFEIIGTADSVDNGI